MEAAHAGQADMAEAEALMAAARAAGERLDRLTNMDVPNRLDEVQAATQKAIDLALRLAPINSFIQNTEQSDEFGQFGGGELNLDLSNLSTEDAISKLKVSDTQSFDQFNVLLSLGQGMQQFPVPYFIIRLAVSHPRVTVSPFDIRDELLASAVM